MKKDSMEEASGSFVKSQRGRPKSRNPKRIQRLLAVSLSTFVRNKGTSRKIV